MTYTTITEEHIDRLLRLSSEAHSIGVAIYNLIRSVGHENLSADNALHIMTEYEHRAAHLGDDILTLKHDLCKKKGGEA